MIKKRKILIAIIAICVAVCSAVSILVVYAAYYGKGMFKDVFVNKKYYFSSDVLSSIASIESTNANPVRSGGADKYVYLMNYDTATGEYDDFDLTFSVYAWLSNNSKSYTININGTNYVINSTTPNVVCDNITLVGGKKTSFVLSINLGFTESDDLSAYPYLNLVAVPTSPAFMASRIIGARIEPSFSQAFMPDCYFESAVGLTDETAVDNELAAFLYVVSTIGEPNENEKLRVKWNSNKLTLIENSLPAQISVENIADVGTDGFTKYVEFGDIADLFERLTFMYVQGVPDENNPWVGETVTWGKIKNCVGFELVQSTSTT